MYKECFQHKKITIIINKMIIPNLALETRKKSVSVKHPTIHKMYFLVLQLLELNHTSGKIHNILMKIKNVDTNTENQRYLIRY